MITTKAGRKLRLISLIIGWSFIGMGILGLLFWLLDSSYGFLPIFGIAGISILGVFELFFSSRLGGTRPAHYARKLLINQCLAFIYMLIMLVPLCFIDAATIVAEMKKMHPELEQHFQTIGTALGMSMDQALALAFRIMGLASLIITIPLQTAIILYYRKLAKQIAATPTLDPEVASAQATRVE